MQSHYPAHFERDMSCTESDWLQRLPAALGDVSWQRAGRQLQAEIAGGRLTLTWQWAPDRPLSGLVRMPRLLAQFDFGGVNDEARYRFMKRFDLYMLRGGG